jgi:cobalt-zinc-cadmium efflux system outer membrane protein
MCAKRILLLVLSIVLASGCATFHAKPISPVQTAVAFEARSLKDPGLKKFLETNLSHEIVPWPPKKWNLTMLTLAAFYYHPDLDIARDRWGVAKAGMVTAAGRPNPTISLVPEYATNSDIGTSPWLFGINLDIPIETAGKRGYRIARAKHQSEAFRFNIAVVAWQVRSRLRERLLDFYAAKHAESILKQGLALQEDYIKLLEKRHTAGEISPSNLAESKLLRDQAVLSLLEVQKKAADANVQIADALGLPVRALSQTVISFDQFDQILLLKNFNAKEIRREALLGRADILKALSEYAASESALRLEIAKQYPDINLIPGYSYDQGENKWAIGFSFTLPVFNRNKGPIAEAEARRKEAADNFIAIQAKVIGEIDGADTAYRSTLQKLKEADSYLADQKKRYQLLEETPKVLEVTRPTLLRTQEQLSSAEIYRLNAFVDVQHALGQLEDAVQRPLIGSLKSISAPETDPKSIKEDEK